MTTRRPDATGGGTTVTAEVEAPDESGSPPGDRAFRPDVEGLRAVAVLLVVLYHAGLGWLPGGYVGVDVFFVISGFVITGVLLRERSTTGGTSLLHFYARRARRILPAATLVLVATVLLAGHVLGPVFGARTAGDARWAAVFLANVHLAAQGTDYLTARLPPSLLQNFWSLAVEEQFYLVYPAVVAVVAALPGRVDLRRRLLAVLAVTCVGSYLLSVVQTASHPTNAYFSPLTRAWELGLGAALAASAPWLRRVPAAVAAAATWVGLAGVVASAVAFTAATAYPGSLAALPVVGTALVVGGGFRAPMLGAESLLGLRPLRWLGRQSYSLYLWHWPILLLAADDAGRTSLPFHRNLVWLVVSLAAAVVTVRLVEQPVRHSIRLRGRPGISVALGAGLVACTLVVATLVLQGGGPAPSAALAASARRSVVTSGRVVAAAVRASTDIDRLPADLQPSLADVVDDWGGVEGPCWPATTQSTVPACVFGDPHGARTLVLLGDSHAAMWFSAVDLLARADHWRLVLLSKGYCPPTLLTFATPAGVGGAGRAYAACAAWHRTVVARVRALHPDLVVVTQEVANGPSGPYRPAAWQSGLVALEHALGVPGRRLVVLGNIPVLPDDPPTCLSLHPDDVQACSGPLHGYLDGYDAAELAAARAVGATYVDVTPWFCAARCSPVVGRYEVYWDRYHVTASYSLFLAGPLGAALDLPGRAAGS